jgi:N-acetylglutamate synthase-like GNAT family acetyltransferase
MPDPVRPTRKPDASRYRSATRPPRRTERAAADAMPTHAAAEAFTTPAGHALFLRPIEPGDADALRRAFARLTPEQVRLRLFHRVNELPAEVARRMATIDPATTIAYVAVDADGEIRGEARIHIDAVTDTGEFAVAVDPGYTQQGIGRRLMTRLAEDARRRGLYEVWGDVLAGNHTMLDFVKTLGAERRTHPDEPGITRVSMRLR